MDDVGQLKEVNRSELLMILDQVRGEKDLVIDPNLMTILNHFTTAQFLKKNGIGKMYRLENTHLDSSAKSRVYLMRAYPSLISSMIYQILEDRKRRVRCNYHLVAVPQMTHACSALLEQHGLFGDVQISGWPLDLLPLDKDLLSLELPSIFTDLYLAGDQHGIRIVAQSLITLQSLYGTIPTIHGLGRYSAMVRDLFQLLSADQETGATVAIEGEPRIEQLILFDRSCDSVTPLCSPTTYEGLLDDVFGIKNGFVEFDKLVTGKDQKIKLLLNSSDSVYAEIRSRHFTAVHSHLSGLAKQLQTGYDRRHDMTTVQEMKAFVTDLSGMKQQHRSLATHVGACEVINKKKRASFLQKQLQIEHATLEGLDERECLELIEELINRQVSVTTPLRLLCLQSLTSGGLKPKTYQLLKTQFLQAYGYDHIVTLSRLEEMGWLKEQSDKQVPVFRTATKRLKLIPRDSEGYDLSKPPDTAYVFGGAYCPLSCHLAQHAMQNGGWQGIEDFCQLLTKDVFTISQVASQRKAGVGRSITVVYFIGGCTFSEVNALRFIAQQTGKQILVATTNLCQGTTMLQDIIKYT
ncbi:vacuolar protein sorting-associated protein 33B-like [Sycon ciliatum]|uniref:vacuolar protein sorting-associated protein 33B-like n=1 Tax=Sycon ciliatum TaxID=27933 RepID=UPI0020AC09E5|eukprot:scpid46488/ scgid10838/ Vacuolar protein sorting-associated protein 33B